jgi:hypothetical protein
MLEAGKLLSMSNEDLIKVLPRVGIAMQLSGLAKQNATRRNGVQPWAIDRFVENSVQSLVANSSQSQQGGMLAVLQKLMLGQQDQPKEVSNENTLDKISKSLHAIHKRQDASDELLAKLDDKLNKL